MPELRPVFIVLIHTELNSQAVILIVIWSYSKGDMRMTQGTVRSRRVGFFSDRYTKQLLA